MSAEDIALNYFDGVRRDLGETEVGESEEVGESTSGDGRAPGGE